MPKLENLTSVEVGERADWLLVLPVGSTEQHGAHLPVATDTIIATELTRRLDIARDDVLIAPAVAIGASGEHAGFSGTLSIGVDALTAVLIEIGRSGDDTASRVLFLNGHGGNHSAINAAVSLLQAESRDVRAWSPRIGGDAHAGRSETSMMLALRPDLVGVDRMAPGDSRSLQELLPLLRDGGVKAVTPTGVLGDPTQASAEIGRELLDAAAADLLAAVAAWVSGSPPRPKSDLR